MSSMQWRKGVAMAVLGASLGAAGYALGRYGGKEKECGMHAQGAGKSCDIHAMGAGERSMPPASGKAGDCPYMAKQASAKSGPRSTEVPGVSELKNYVDGAKGPVQGGKK